MDVFQWIEEARHPKVCNSEEFIYEDMDSQSGRSLPIVYGPFDAREKSHWRDRGSLFDFLHSVHGEGTRLLDFGPGDGWPSLIIAPFAAEVVGVEGSRRRISVCTENARRLGTENVRYVFVPPGSSLPFDDESFDGAMAASSVEQTPDPKATLVELFRILRPNGCLRIAYESLSRYQNGNERDIWLWGINAECCRLILFDRDIADESVRQYGLTYGMPTEDLTRAISPDGRSLSFPMVTADRLEALGSSLIDARLCVTHHPSGKTIASWLREIGFRQVNPTHSGADAAGALYDAVPEERRAADMKGVDDLVRPVAEIVTQLEAPLDMDPMITAIK